MIDVHANAVVDKNAELADGVKVGPNAIIESGAVIGENTQIGANAYIGRDVRIGKNNTLFPGCFIGCRPQILGATDDSPRGKLVIGDGNTIREMATIHPSMHEKAETVVGNNNLIMVGVHIGHDCVLDDNIVMSNSTQLSGHCKVEKGVWLSGMVAVHQFTTIGKWAYAAGLTGINRDIPPFLLISGHYPSLVRGINERGMNRAGLNDEEKESVTKAYKMLYRQGGALAENARKLAAEDGLDKNVRAMVDSILNSDKQRFGRYLELFR